MADVKKEDMGPVGTAEVATRRDSLWAGILVATDKLVNWINETYWVKFLSCNKIIGTGKTSENLLRC